MVACFKRFIFKYKHTKFELNRKYINLNQNNFLKQKSQNLFIILTINKKNNNSNFYYYNKFSYLLIVTSNFLKSVWKYVKNENTCKCEY